MDANAFAICISIAIIAVLMVSGYLFRIGAAISGRVDALLSRVFPREARPAEPVIDPMPDPMDDLVGQLARSIKSGDGWEYEKGEMLHTASHREASVCIWVPPTVFEAPILQIHGKRVTLTREQCESLSRAIHLLRKSADDAEAGRDREALARALRRMATTNTEKVG